MKTKRKITTIICILICALAMTSTAYGHGGRTDSSGGHRDNRNVSGLGYYHYHCGGYPAHLHNNGKCPYKSGYTSGTTSYHSAGTSLKGAVKKTPKLKTPKLRSVSDEGNELKVSWSSVSGAKKYAVYRAFSRNGSYKKIKTTTKTVFYDDAAATEKTYYYKVKAIGGVGKKDSKFSGIKSGKITFKEEIYVDKEEISLAYGQSEVIEVWTDNEENLITAYYDGNLLKLEWIWTDDGNSAIKVERLAADLTQTETEILLKFDEYPNLYEQKITVELV